MSQPLGSGKVAHTLRGLIVFFGLAGATACFAQGVSFNVGSQPRQVRGEGATEVVGEVVLLATGAGTIPAGSTIAISYGGTITSGRAAEGIPAGSVTCFPAAVCPDALLSSGNQLTLSYTTARTLAANNTITISGVRVDVASLGPGVISVSATLSGGSSAPGSNPVTFVQTLVPVASVVSPSLTVVAPATAAGTPSQGVFLITCNIGSAAGNVFHIAVTETFAAALTTVAQESTFSATPPASNGTQIRVRFIGVPAGLEITALAPAAPAAPGLLTVELSKAFPVGITSTGEDIAFTYTVTASNLAAIETLVLPFTAGLPGGAAGSIPSVGGTVTVGAEVSLAPIGGNSIVRFAAIQSTGADFSLALSPSSSSVTAGTSVAFTVSINALRGFAGQVDLFCQEMVAGTGCSFSSDRSPPGSATLTFFTSTFTPTGTLNVRIVGTSGGLIRFATATLTIVAPIPAPAFTAASITNGASFVTGATPGSIITIFGTRLTRGVTGVVAADKVPLPTQLQGTSVTVNGIAAPLLSIANVNGQEQITLQVPYEVTGQATVAVVVNNNGEGSAPVQVALLPAHPGIFTVDGTAGAILHGSDFQLVSSSSPAAKGEVVVLYATGLGPVSPAPRSGSPALSSPLSLTTFAPVVTVGGIAAEVSFSGLAPGFVGLYQVNLRVSENLPSGNLDVVIQAAGQTSKAVKLAVQ